MATSSFPAKADGVYRPVVTSFREFSIGSYTLRIREFRNDKRRAPQQE